MQDLFTLNISTELLAIILGTPGPGDRHIGLPALLWGAPGAGKTSAIEAALHQMNWGFQVLSPQHDEVSYGMVPVIDQATKRVTCYPPDWIDKLGNDSCVVLDDLTSSSPSVQAAQLRLLTHRETASVQLPTGCRLIGIANPPKEGTNARPLDDATANRLIHVQVRQDALDVAALVAARFRSPAVATGLREKLAQISEGWSAAFERECYVWSGFLSAHKVLGTQDRRDDLEVTVSASPRSVELACRAVTAARQLNAPHLIPALVAGSIGRGQAGAFVQYSQRVDVPSLTAVLTGAWRVTESTSADVVFIVLSKLVDAVPERPSGSPELLKFWELVEQSISSKRPRDIMVPLVKRLYQQKGVLPPPKSAATSLLESVIL